MNHVVLAFFFHKETSIGKNRDKTVENTYLLNIKLVTILCRCFP